MSICFETLYRSRQLITKPIFVPCILNFVNFSGFYTSEPSTQSSELSLQCTCSMLNNTSKPFYCKLHVHNDCMSVPGYKRCMNTPKFFKKTRQQPDKSYTTERYSLIQGKQEVPYPQVETNNKISPAKIILSYKLGFTVDISK